MSSARMMTAKTGADAAGCRLLPWDSEFFGRRIARVEPPAILHEAGIASAWLRDNRIECVYLLADASDQTTIDAAVSQGFNLVDVRVTLEASGAPTAAGPRSAPAGISGASAGEQARVVT